MWPKKSNQKKGHPGGTPSALRAAGAQSPREFSEGTSLCPPKTLRIVRSAPAGFYPSRLPCPGGPMKNKRASGLQCGIAWKAIVLDLAFNPVEARQAGGANTRRAARTMRAVSGRHRDVPSGNAPPACASVTRSGTDGPTGWPSLVTFLATQESDPRKARSALGFGQCSRPVSQSHTRFRIPIILPPSSSAQRHPLPVGEGSLPEQILHSQSIT